MPPEIVRRLIGGVWRTVEADASSNGGSQPIVSCVLGAVGVLADLEVNGQTQFKWTVAWDNVFDFNVLPGLPAGIGLSNPVDGSSADLLTTVAGTWWFEVGVGLDGVSAVEGAVGLTQAIAGNYFGPGTAASGERPSYGALITLPSGVNQAALLNVVTQASTSGNARDAELIIARLA
jgi:hypothetical protein